MNFDDIRVKESPGLCRCCFAEGCYKDLSTEYIWMNEHEVYADMLLDCFDIVLSQHTEGPNGSKQHICEVCIARLRDACNFKRQILETERKFVDMLARGVFQPKVIIHKTEPVKTEDLVIEQALDETEVEYLDEMDYEDDQPLYQVTQPLEVPVPNVASKEKGKRVVQNQAVTVKTAKKPKVLKPRPLAKAHVKGKPGGSQKMVEDISDSEISNNETLSDDCETKISELMDTVKQCNKPIKRQAKTDKRKIIRNNIAQILLKSTVIPFRWLKSSYRCFYCYDIFHDFSDLKDHQNTHTDDETKLKTINNYWEDVVYVDVSNLSCKLCPEKIANLNDLIDHLVKHGVDYNKDVGICIVAFKVDNCKLNCLDCGETFYSFVTLLHHTINDSYKGCSINLANKITAICEVCGKDFNSESILRIHVKNVHEMAVKCKECGERFKTRSALETHQKKQHGIERKFKCFVCPVILPSHYHRRKHLINEHKYRPETKCLHCPKTFLRRSMMMTHVRRYHLMEKNHVCNICGYRTFSNSLLRLHMNSHGAEKNVKCDGCVKVFTSRKLMRRHFKRIHKNLIQQENALGKQ